MKPNEQCRIDTLKSIEKLLVGKDQNGIAYFDVFQDIPQHSEPDIRKAIKWLEEECFIHSIISRIIYIEAAGKRMLETL